MAALFAGQPQEAHCRAGRLVMRLKELAARKGSAVDYQKLEFDYTRHPEADYARTECKHWGKLIRANNIKGG
jgi:hypothetical protein